MNSIVGRISQTLLTFLVLSLCQQLPARAALPSGSNIIEGRTDSLEINLKRLADALHGLDSALSSLKGQHFDFHLDSMSFGPFHTPNVHVGPLDLPEWDVHVPEIDVPSVDIPKIEIPEIDEHISIGDLDESVDIDSVLRNDSGNYFNSKEFQDGLFGNPMISGYLAESSAGTLPFNDHSPMVTKHYYSDGKTKFFINNSETTPNTVKMEEQVGKSSVWLIGEKK
jgi:hypothetical protein